MNIWHLVVTLLYNLDCFVTELKIFSPDCNSGSNYLSQTFSCLKKCIHVLRMYFIGKSDVRHKQAASNALLHQTGIINSGCSITSKLSCWSFLKALHKRLPHSKWVTLDPSVEMRVSWKWIAGKCDRGQESANKNKR